MSEETLPINTVFVWIVDPVQSESDNENGELLMIPEPPAPPDFEFNYTIQYGESFDPPINNDVIRVEAEPIPAPEIIEKIRRAILNAEYYQRVATFNIEFVAEL